MSCGVRFRTLRPTPILLSRNFCVVAGFNALSEKGCSGHREVTTVGNFLERDTGGLTTRGKECHQTSCGNSPALEGGVGSWWGR